MKIEKYNTEVKKEYFICKQCICSACTRFQCPRSSRWAIYSCKVTCDGLVTECDFFKNRFRDVRYHFKRKKKLALTVDELRQLQNTINEILGEPEQAVPELTPKEWFVQEVQKEREKRKQESISTDDGSC